MSCKMFNIFLEDLRKELKDFKKYIGKRIEEFYDKDFLVIYDEDKYIKADTSDYNMLIFEEKVLKIFRSNLYDTDKKVYNYDLIFIPIIDKYDYKRIITYSNNNRKAEELFIKIQKLYISCILYSYSKFYKGFTSHFNDIEYIEKEIENVKNNAKQEYPLLYLQKNDNLNYDIEKMVLDIINHQTIQEQKKRQKQLLLSYIINNAKLNFITILKNIHIYKITLNETKYQGVFAYILYVLVNNNIIDKNNNRTALINSFKVFIDLNSKTKTYANNLGKDYKINPLKDTDWINNEIKEQLKNTSKKNNDFPIILNIIRHKIPNNLKVNFNLEEKEIAIISRLFWDIDVINKNKTGLNSYLSVISSFITYGKNRNNIDFNSFKKSFINADYKKHTKLLNTFKL